MAVGSAVFFTTVLICFIDIVSGEGYTQPLARDDAEARNKVTVNCRRSGFEVEDPLWYFNGSLYHDNSCTQEATAEGSSFELVLTPDCEGYIQCGDPQRQDVSIPRLLLSSFDFNSLQ